MISMRWFKGAIVAMLLGLSTSAMARPVTSIEVIDGWSSQGFWVSGFAGVTALIEISGDGDSDLDLRVFDRWGNLVAEDTDWTDDASVTWFPRANALYWVEVTNLGYDWNEYWLRVDVD